MPSVPTNTRSFAGGEVTPEFFGRIDDAKYQSGLARCRNFVVKPHGPLENRAGFEHVAEVKDSTKATRLLPFVFAEDQSFAIEVGDTYFRFHTLGETLLVGSTSAWNGATAYTQGMMASLAGSNWYCIAAHTNHSPPNATYWYEEPADGVYEIPHIYAAADLFALKFVQSNDVITLTHQSYPPAELRRIAGGAWTFSIIDFSPVMSPPGSVTATATPAVSSPGTPTIQAYVVTSISQDGKEESVASNSSTQGSLSISAITKANPGVFTTSYSTPVPSVGDKVYVSGVGGMSEINNGYYLINSISSVAPTSLDLGYGFGAIETPGSCTITLKSLAGTPTNTTGFSTYTNGGTIQVQGAARCSNNLFDSGAYNTIAWSSVTGAARYYIYKASNGLYGYIGQTEGQSFTDDNIAADISKTPPIANSPFEGAGNYPAAVGYFEQRRGFAGTGNDPARVRLTRSGTEANLAYSIPGRDDDAIDFRIAARERNGIRHMVPLQDLLLLSEAAEWRVQPAAGAVLTPDVSVHAQSYIGAADAAPQVINNNVLFAAARGGHIRELAYNWQAGGYVTGDVSIRAPHLFDGYTIADSAYAKAPIPIVWFVSSSGKLLGLTYVPEQEVGAWHWHDTKDGTFESVCVVPEGGEDVLYVVTNRAMTGGSKRFVERMRSRRISDPADGFFVDCGATYDSTPATTISGLTWLEGKTVNILADGAVVAPQTVTGGAITLEAAASLVHVGLPITADVETLPIAVEVQGYAQGRPKNISEVWIRLYESRGLFAGPNFTRLTELKQRTTEPADSPPSATTGEVRLSISPTWAQSGSVCIRQSDPLPLTLVSLTLSVAVGGG